MVVCPVALAVGCRKCPIFSVCPVKTVIGDYVPPKKTSSPRAAAADAAPAAKSAKAKPKAADKSASGDGKRRNSRRRTH